MYRNTHSTRTNDIKIVLYFFNMWFTRYSQIHIARVSAFFLSHHLLYHHAYETVAFFCFTRRYARTYSHTNSYSYVCSCVQSVITEYQWGIWLLLWFTSPIMYTSPAHVKAFKNLIVPVCIINASSINTREYSSFTPLTNTDATVLTSRNQIFSETVGYLLANLSRISFAPFFVMVKIISFVLEKTGTINWFIKWAYHTQAVH